MTHDDQSTNTPDEHDVRLTAYALGELSPEERAEVEALLAADDDARADVDEMNALAGLLAGGLAAEPVGALDSAARDAVLVAADAGPTVAPVRRMWPLVGMAASVLVGVGVASRVAPEPGSVVPEVDVARYTRVQGARERLAAVHSTEDVSEGTGVAVGPGGMEMLYGTPVEGDPEWDAKVPQAAGAVLSTRDEPVTEGERIRIAFDGEGLEFRANERQPDPSITTGTYEDSAPPATASEAGKPNSAVGIGGSVGRPWTGQSRGGVAAAPPPTPPATSNPETTVVGSRTAEPLLGGGGGGTGGGGSYRGATGEVPPKPTVAFDRTKRLPWPSSKTVVHALGRRRDNGVAHEKTATSTVAGGTAVDGDYVAVSGVHLKTVAALKQLDVAAVRVLRMGVNDTTLNEALAKDFRVALQGIQKGFTPQLKIDAPQLLTYLEVIEGKDKDSLELHAEARRLRRYLEAERLRLGFPGTEDYAHPGESPFLDPRQQPLSTFSIDVDTGAYSNVRRFLNEGRLPPREAVRIEEMLNYFKYSAPESTGNHPIGSRVEVAGCPWNSDRRLVRVSLRARALTGQAPPANLVFLIDVSGSMEPENKLPLLKRSIGQLARKMREQDRVAIVVYSGTSAIKLESTNGANQAAILAAIDSLHSGGSTNGASGIQMAYDIARKHKVEGGTNRVILATDGDFNVGVTDRNELITLIQNEAKSGVFLTVLGVGTGNIKEATLEQLANKGNGNYAYLDSLREGRRVLVDEMHGTLVAVAKDVKVQVEFNPAQVASYRLVGYENRALAARDFNDDKKDAGEMGAGHTVTALYEIVPTGGTSTAGVDRLKYQPQPKRAVQADASGELLTLKVRYKHPESSTSVKFETPVTDGGSSYAGASDDFKFASSVAAFGMLLRGDRSSAGTSYAAVLELAGEALGDDVGGYRAEFVDLVARAKTLSGR